MKPILETLIEQAQKCLPDPNDPFHQTLLKAVTDYRNACEFGRGDIVANLNLQRRAMKRDGAPAEHIDAIKVLYDELHKIDSATQGDRIELVRSYFDPRRPGNEGRVRLALAS